MTSWRRLAIAFPRLSKHDVTLVYEAGTSGPHLEIKLKLVSLIMFP